MVRVADDEFLRTSINDDERSELPWLDRLGFNNWIKIRYRKVNASSKEKIQKGCMKMEAPSDERIPNDVRDENEEEYKTRWGEEKTVVSECLLKISLMKIGLGKRNPTMMIQMESWTTLSYKGMIGSRIRMMKHTNNEDVNSQVFLTRDPHRLWQKILKLLGTIQDLMRGLPKYRKLK